MTLTTEQLKKCIPDITEKNIQKYLPELNANFDKYEINTPLRVCHFLAQVGHESLSFYYYREIASGKAYEGRKDLGNIIEGDGERFRGRGCIQITGRTNYKSVSQFIFGDYRLLDTPEILELPKYGVLGAVWFWKTRNLNIYADKDDVKRITKIINGGYNGFNDRLERLNKCKSVLLYK